MFDNVVFPGILLFVFSFLLVQCSAQEEGVVYLSDDDWKTETPLQCYDCNSLYDPGCADPFNNYTVGTVDCSETKIPEHLVNIGERPNTRLKPTVCRKIVQIVGEQTRVIRECGFLQDDRDDKECIRRSGTKDVLVYYCSCTTSFCNSSYNIRPSLFSLGVALFAIFFLIFFRY